MSEERIPRIAERSFAGTRHSVAAVRAWARGWLDQCGVPAEVTDNAVLVLSELATNAVVHSRSSGPHGTYLVLLRRGVSRLRVEVADAGGPTEPRAARNGHPPDPDDTALASAALAHPVGQEGGHGLALVEAFTSCWWTRGDSHSRTVCAELPLTIALT